MSTTEQADNRVLIVLALSVLGVIVGSFGPWATVWMFTVNGTAGDGQITLVLGLIAGAMLAWQYFRPGLGRWRAIVMLLSFAGAALVGVYDWTNITRVANETGFGASVAWGLPMMTIAAIAGVVASGVRLRMPHPAEVATQDVVSEQI